MRGPRRTVDLASVVLVALLGWSMARLIVASTSLPWHAAGAVAAPTLLLLAVVGRCRSKHPQGDSAESGQRTQTDRLTGSAPITAFADDQRSGTVPFSDRAGEAFGEDGVISQSWERRIDRSGRESILGDVLVSFAAGERSAWVHIPWQPPMATVPVVMAEVVEGEGVAVAVDLVRAYGMRLSARRSGDVHAPQHARIEFFVTEEDCLQAAA